MKSRYFLTHIASKRQTLSLGLSVAAFNFSNNLIEGKIFNKTYSILPSFIKSVNTDEENNFEYVISKLRQTKHLRFIALIKENISIFHKIPKGSIIWYYNCTTLNIFLIWILHLLKPSVRQFMIMLDYTPELKFNKLLVLPTLKIMDGMIKLADYKSFKLQNSVCLPGITPCNIPDYPIIETPVKKFLLSGVLDYQITMLPQLIEVFKQIPKAELHITGKFTNNTKVDALIQNIPNIHYHGMLEYKDYINLMHECTFLLSTRNPEASENKCNFPSKIIEGLMHNRIVLSTIHYSQLGNLNIIEVDHKNMLTEFQKICNMPENELLKYANQQTITIDKFSADVWKSTIIRLENNAKKL